MVLFQHSNTSTHVSSNRSTVAVVLGAQIGDEGKGKLVDLLASEADVVCRFQGGNNAGHTVIANGAQYYFETLPSGFHLSHCINIIGNGCVVNLPYLFEEIKEKESQGVSDWAKRLFISDRAHLIFEFHKEMDILIDQKRAKNKIGTTNNGVGPAYSSKVIRNGIRMIDLMGPFERFAEKLRMLYTYHKNAFPELKFDLEKSIEQFKKLAEYFRPVTLDTIAYLNKCITAGSKKIVIEGAQGTMLDIDFGVYPYVTSSACSIGGVLSGLGLAPKYLDDIYGVVRAYMYRYGTGFFPTQLNNEVGKYLFTRGNEQTNTDGINGRCGWLDLIIVKYTNMINGYTALCLTKLDVLDELVEIKVAIAYKKNGTELQNFPTAPDMMDGIEVEYVTFPGWLTSISECQTFDSLPENAKCYVQFIEKYLDVPVKWIGIGRDREAMIRVF